MRLALLATLVLLTACQNSFHTDHNASDAVTLIFSSNDLPAQPAICVPGTGFRDTRFAVGRAGSKILDDLNEAMKKSAEVTATVAASDTLVAGFRYRDSGRAGAEKNRCRRAVRFAAETGQTYHLRLDDAASCAVSVTQSRGEEQVRVDAENSDWICQ
jgi:hypothetical protein